MSALEARLGCITGAPNEDLDDAARHYRQSIYKLSHKISQIKSEVRFNRRGRYFNCVVMTEGGIPQRKWDLQAC